MDRDQIDFSTVLDDLRDCQAAACRVCLSKRNGVWSVTNILIDINLPDVANPNWTKYEYADVAFAQDMITIEELATWLTSLNGKLRGLAFEIPQPQQRVERERYSTDWVGIISFNCLVHLRSIRLIRLCETMVISAVLLRRW